MNKFRPYFCILVFLLIGVTHCYGQDFPMLHFTVDDGLPSNTIYQVYRDSKGYLWFSSDKGVAKYNGIKFEKFTSNEGLADNEIFSVREDYYGRLWMLTYNGELCYYEDGVFHTAANTPFLKLPFKTSYIVDVYLNKDSSITLNYYNYRNMVNIYRNYAVPHVFSDTSSEFNFPFSVRKTSSDRYDLTMKYYDMVMDTTFHILSCKKRDKPRILFHTRSQDADYLFDSSFLYTVDRKIIRQFKPGFFDHNFIHIYYADSVNYFYATVNGLFINDSIQILKDLDVTSVAQDNNGNYWIGTLKNGVYCIKKDFLKTYILRNAYPNLVRYCYVDSSHLFFAVSNNNLYSYRDGTVACVFDYKSFKNADYKFPADAGYLVQKKGEDYNYYNFYGDSKIIIKDLLSPHARRFSFENDFALLNIKAVFADGDDIYLKGRDALINIGDPIENASKMLGHHLPENSRLVRLFGAAQSPDNSIFFSTIDSVYKIQNDQRSLQPQFGGLAFKVMGIYNDYLIGITHNNKLIICNNYNDHIAYDSVTGHDCIWLKLQKIDATHILVSTDNLYRLITLRPSTGKPDYSVMTIENPFIPLNVEAIASDGRNCYFFKSGSITSIDVNSVLVRADAPRLTFSSLKTSKRFHAIDSEVTLLFSEAKNITISFSTLSFGGKNVFYQYSVSRSENDGWRPINGEDINLVNSGYGTYFIKVRAKTGSSEYCVPIVFTLHILRPYWATWWFIAVVVLLATALVAWLIRRRIVNAVRKKEQEHESEIRFLRSEHKALNALMNPHFIFNTLNNVQGLVNRDDKLAANEYLRVFADLIRQNMQNISKELIPLRKEIDLITNYLFLEKLRFKEQLNYTITIDESLDLNDIMISPLLVQPLVENSVKHGILPLESTGGIINVNIYPREGKLYVEVKDNGVGMGHAGNNASHNHESLGLENIKKRIEQLSIIQNKQIEFRISEVRDEAGGLQWTVMTISMPLT